MSVWVTRSAPDNLSTARGLKALGRKPLLVPVLTTRAVPHDEPGATPDAMLFSSVHAVRHHSFGERFRQIPVFAASGAVAAAAAAAGYLSVTSTGSDENALAGLMRHILPHQARIAMLCAERTSDTLEAGLQAGGARPERVVVYEPAALEDPELATAVDRLDRIVAITVHSRTAAERLLPLLRRADWRGSLWCMSRAAGLPFANVPGLAVAVSEEPSEAAFLSMIADMSPPRPPRARSAPRRASMPLLRTPARPGNDNDLPG